MADQIINSNPEKAEIILLGAPYDKTSSFGKGADLAPKIIIELLNNQVEQYERYTQTNPTNNIKIAELLLQNISQLSPEMMVKELSQKYFDLYQRGKFILTIGGEHSITNGPLEALSKLEDPKQITIVHIDAHFDLRPDDSDYNDKPWGKYAHSAVMRRAIEKGFKVVSIGVRAYHKELELNYAKSNNLKFFEWGIDKDPAIEEIVKAIDTDKVYLSIDVDGFDPAVMPSTGTPVVDGIQWRYAIQLFKKISEIKKIISADIVEVIPKPSPDPTAYNAALLVHYLIALKIAKLLPHSAN